MAVPDYLQDFTTDFARQAKATYSAALDPKTFMGPQFIAGLDPLQTQAIGLAQAGVGSYAPFLASAQQAISQAGQDVAGLGQFAGTGAGTGPGSIQDFQSPYQQAVIDETLRAFDESRIGGRQTIQDAAVAAGAFGGGREGALLGQYDADSLTGRAGLRAGLLQQGFQDAAARRANAFQQQQAMAGARAGLAGQQFGLSNFMRQGLGQDISALGGLGALRQGLDQSRLTATQQAEQASAMEPYGRLERFGTALTGLSGGVATPAMPQTTPNPFSTALSNALGIGNLFANVYGAMKGA
tara:strand:+ start:1495 stop:2385 length:891 start_codon:yes stop_codon:yes gene_type:complete